MYLSFKRVRNFNSYNGKKKTIFPKILFCYDLKLCKWNIFKNAIVYQKNDECFALNGLPCMSWELWIFYTILLYLL